jgi:hypothetical protein
MTTWIEALVGLLDCEMTIVDSPDGLVVTTGNSQATAESGDFEAGS